LGKVLALYFLQKAEEYLHQLSDYQFVKKDFTAQG
jgi:hypothetical protein